jgi:hypothetical protein
MFDTRKKKAVKMTTFSNKEFIAPKKISKSLHYPCMLFQKILNATSREYSKDCLVLYNK